MKAWVHVRGGLGIALCFGASGGVWPRDAREATCPRCRRIVEKLRPEFLRPPVKEDTAAEVADELGRRRQ